MELGHHPFAHHRGWDLAVHLPVDRRLELQSGGLSVGRCIRRLVEPSAPVQRNQIRVAQATLWSE